MSKNNITLKDIAEKTNTSITTVYRAIHNKEGISDKLRRKILKVSDEMGYSVNFAASSLSKKTTNLVYISPKKDKYSHYYTEQILNGYMQCKKDFDKFNINFQEYFYDFNEEGIMKVLNQILNKDDKIDGMIIFPLISKKITKALDDISRKNIPIILIEKDAQSINRISCIKPNDSMAGKIAGELLSKFIHTQGKIIIACGDAMALGQEHLISNINCSSCEIMISEERKDLSVEMIDTLNTGDQLYKEIKNKIINEADIKGIYCTTARGTVSVAKAIDELRLEKEIVLIGSEVFEENIKMLEKGVIDCIINKNPYSLGKRALMILFDYVMRLGNIEDEYMISPDIVFRSNLT